MDEFVQAATSGRRARAEALSASATADPWVRLVRGEGWEGDANAPGGPNGWAPLLYVTHSVLRVRRRSRATCSPAAPTRTSPSATSTAR